MGRLPLFLAKCPECGPPRQDPIHYVLRHAENQAGGTRGGEGQNKLPLGIVNGRLISYLAGKFTFSIKIWNKLKKAMEIGPSELFEEVVGPETGQSSTFWWKMTHALSIGVVKRSRRRRLKQRYRQRLTREHVYFSGLLTVTSTHMFFRNFFCILTLNSKRFTLDPRMRAHSIPFCKGRRLLVYWTRYR